MVPIPMQVPTRPATGGDVHDTWQTQACDVGSCGERDAPRCKHPDQRTECEGDTGGDPQTNHGCAAIRCERLLLIELYTNQQSAELTNKCAGEHGDNKKAKQG